MTTPSNAPTLPTTRFPKLAPLIEYLDSLTSRADLAVLDRLLGNVDVTRNDIEPVCLFGTGAYKRNTVSRSEWYELLAICWRSGHCTPIHDHKGSSCAFRIVEGIGTEVRFTMTDSGLICPVATTQMHPGYICSARDDDIHQVANMQAPGRDLVTMHIYSPPIGKMATYTFATMGQADAPEQYQAQLVAQGAV